MVAVVFLYALHHRIRFSSKYSRHVEFTSFIHLKPPRTISVFKDKIIKTNSTKNREGLERVREDMNGESEQQPQNQKCPRCDSLNTKFCYYNNYSLSQPRYFCKTCKRYWTKGGTLRNIPVGGSCRKGKRPKREAEAPPSTGSPTTTTVRIQDTKNMASPAMPPVPSTTSIYYPGGGFPSSLSAIQSFNQSKNIGGDFGSPNLALMQGFSLPSFSSSQQQLLQNRNFINSTTNFISIDPGYWSSTNSITTLNPIQWPDVPGYGPPP